MYTAIVSVIYDSWYTEYNTGTEISWYGYIWLNICKHSKIILLDVKFTKHLLVTTVLQFFIVHYLNFYCPLKLLSPKIGSRRRLGNMDCIILTQIVMICAIIFTVWRKYFFFQNWNSVRNTRKKRRKTLQRTCTIFYENFYKEAEALVKKSDDKNILESLMVLRNTECKLFARHITC